MTILSFAASLYTFYLHCVSRVKEHFCALFLSLSKLSLCVFRKYVIKAEMSSFSSSSSSFPSSEDAQNHHPPSEEEFAFDGDDGNVLDAILHRVDFIWERTRAKLEDVYHHPELIVLVLFSLVLAHFIAGRIFFNKGKERKIGSKNSKKRDSIVLCGQDGAGSTSAYLLLKNKSLGLGTVTSSIENESEVEICVSSDRDAKEKRVKVNVVDVPGHAKIRNRFYERFLPRAKGIVFFVDGVEFSTNKRDVADHLYNEILIDYDNVRRKRIPILIACNKTDKEACSPATFVKKRLESEIEMIRTTRDVMLKDAQFDDGSRKAKKRAKEIEKKREREVTGLGWKDEWGKFSFDKAAEMKTHGRFLFCACSCVGEDREWKLKKEAEEKGDDGSDNNGDTNNSSGGDKTSNSGGSRNLSAVKAFAAEHAGR